MIKYFYEKRIEKPVQKAEEYIALKYTAPQIPPEVKKPSAEQTAPGKPAASPPSPVKPTSPGTNAGEVRESRKLFPPSDSETRYSLRGDSYDSESIDSALRGLSSNLPASAALKIIDRSTDLSFSDSTVEKAGQL